MTTLLDEQIDTGDVIEITIGDDVVSALVLLAAEHAVILDACDGSTPFVVRRDELVEMLDEALARGGMPAEE